MAKNFGCASPYDILCCQDSNYPKMRWLTSNASRRIRLFLEAMWSTFRKMCKFWRGNGNKIAVCCRTYVGITFSLLSMILILMCTIGVSKKLAGAEDSVAFVFEIRGSLINSFFYLKVYWLKAYWDLRTNKVFRIFYNLFDICQNCIPTYYVSTYLSFLALNRDLPPFI